ncbi:MAG TPA: hypothetical protein VD913_01940, partial [bacterium]|nr:hypothetical protein [bacterium]
KPTRMPIRTIVFFREAVDDTFHTFEVDGLPFKAPVRVPLWTFPDGILAFNVDYFAGDPSIFSHELQAALAVPWYMFHFDLVSPLPRVRSDAGLAYSYETIQDESLKNSMRSEELDIRKVLISGLSRLLVKEFYLQSFQGVIRSILYGVVMERLSVEKGIQKIKGMIKSDFDKDSYEEKINNIGEILQSDWETFVKDVASFHIYVSGSGSDTDRKRRNRHFFNKFLEGLPAKDFFKAPSVFVIERVTIPVMKLTPQDIVDHGKTLDLEDLWRQKERETIKALLFYEEPDDDDSLTRFPYLHIRLEGKIYTVPKGVPLWTFPKGILAVNITDIEFKVKSVYQALEMALRRKPGRSELRFAGIASEHLELPTIPAVSAAKVLGARSAFGIQAQDAFVIDASLIRNSYDMAVLLTVFSHAPFVVLIENTDSEQAKLIRAVNRKLPDTGRISMAASIDEALLSLSRQKAVLMRRPGVSSTNYSQTRILLSDQFSSDAAALKKQIGDHAIVKVFSLDQFSKIAFGIVNRLGLSDFASQLQDKIFAQLRTSRSA